MIAFTIVAAFTDCGNVNDFPDLGESKYTEPSGILPPGSSEDDEEGGEMTPGIELEDDIVPDETPLASEGEITLKAADGGMFKDFLYNFTYDDETGDYDSEYPPTSYFNASTQEWVKGVKTILVTYSDGGITLDYKNKDGVQKGESGIKSEDFEITKNGAHLTIKAHTKCNYILQGSTANGSFKLYSDKKFIVTMKGVSITNPNGSAINIQKGRDDDGILTGKRGFFVVYNNTKNYLTDGASYDTPADEDQKGVIFSEGKLCFSGSGYLCINGKGKHGIATDDYIYLHKGPQITINASANNDGIKAKDGIYIGGGVLNITCSGNAARGMNTDNIMVVSGGRNTVINTSEPFTDAITNVTSQPYCIKADQSMTMTGGALVLSASKKGGNGIFVGDVFNLQDGIVKMVIKEKPLTYKALNRTGGTLYINGIMVND